MAVELAGTVRMDGDPGPGTHVRVRFSSDRLSIFAGQEVIGEWATNEIGIHALNEGFSIRAEGEEFLLRTEDDAALADEMDLKTATPRIARQVAARHRPEEPELPSPPPGTRTRVGPIAFALSGALLVMGATFLRSTGGDGGTGRGRADVIEGWGVEFWLAFTIVGIAVLATAYALAIDVPGARTGAVILVAVTVILFALAVSDTPSDSRHLTAYGFLGGGLAVGVAVVFSGNLESRS